jgi:hypothetical protein
MLSLVKHCTALVVLILLAFGCSSAPKLERMPAQLTEYSCLANVPKHPRSQMLTRFWAQEYTGLDLVRLALEGYIPPVHARVGILDSDFYLDKTRGLLLDKQHNFRLRKNRWRDVQAPWRKSD